MKHLILLLAATIGQVFVNTTAMAAKLDPALAPYIGRSQDQRIVRVVLTFNSARKLQSLRPALVSNRVERASIQKQMMQNAIESQSAFVAQLRSWKNQGTPNQFYSLWLINGMILDVPVSKLNELVANPAINTIQADFKIELVRPGNGRWVASNRTGLREEPKFTYGLQKIMIPEYRKALPEKLGQGVRVAVIDTGVDASHPDLKGKVVAFADLVSKKPEPYDDQGHGTHVSGTIGGGDASGESIGVAPKVQFINAKFLDKNGSGTFANAVLAMQWVVDPDGKPETADGAQIVSNSWGGSRPSATADPKDEAMCVAVEAWTKLGIMPVFAAGNSGPAAKTVGLPGGCPLSFTVAASDQNDAIASFSSRGPAVWKTGTFAKPDITAPGVAVKSSLPGNKYANFSGTSMATPHVAGAIALIYQLQPKITVEQMIDVMKKSATKIDNNPNSSGAGRIDVVKASQLLGLRIMSGTPFRN